MAQKKVLITKKDIDSIYFKRIRDLRTDYFKNYLDSSIKTWKPENNLKLIEEPGFMANHITVMYEFEGIIYTGDSLGFMKSIVAKTFEIFFDFKKVMQTGITQIVRYNDVFYISDRGGNVKVVNMYGKVKEANPYFGEIMSDWITKMVIYQKSYKEAWLYIGNRCGDLKGINCATNEEFGISEFMVDNVTQMVLSKDKLFISDSQGYLKCISAESSQLVLDYGRFMEDLITTIVLDDCRLWAGDKNGNLKCINTVSMDLIIEIPKLLDGMVRSMVVYNNNLFVTSHIGTIKSINYGPLLYDDNNVILPSTTFDSSSIFLRERSFGYRIRCEMEDEDLTWQEAKAVVETEQEEKHHLAKKNKGKVPQGVITDFGKILHSPIDEILVKDNLLFFGYNKG